MFKLREQSNACFCTDNGLYSLVIFETIKTKIYGLLGWGNHG